MSNDSILAARSELSEIVMASSWFRREGKLSVSELVSGTVESAAFKILFHFRDGSIPGGFTTNGFTVQTFWVYSRLDSPSLESPSSFGVLVNKSPNVDVLGC